MTATVDVVVIEPGYGEKADAGIFEAKWLLYSYTDTSGLWSREESKDLQFIVKGVGVIIDALFGDGPKRYNIPSSPVALADFDYKNRKPRKLSKNSLPGDKCLVERTKFLEKLIEFKKENSRNKEWEPYAIPLQNFLELVQKIPLSDMGNKGLRYVVPINAFLSALEPKDYRIIPIIGLGLYFDFPEISNACGHGSSIIRLH